jgi:hypothetical protein
VDRLVTLSFNNAVEGAFAVLGSKRLRLSVLGCFCREGRREKRGEHGTHLLLCGPSK